MGLPASLSGREEFVANSPSAGNTGLSQPPQGALASPQGDEER